MSVQEVVKGGDDVKKFLISLLCIIFLPIALIIGVLHYLVKES